MAAYKNAREHNGKFLDIEYANGSMHQFAKDFAGLIEISPLTTEFMDELSPLLTILRTGWTDSKVNAVLFNTLPKALDFQRAHDPEIFKNPNQSAADLFAREIRAETGEKIGSASGI
jgi:hypothetical protein